MLMTYCQNTGPEGSRRGEIVLQRDRVNRGMILFLACNLFLFISFFFVLTIVFVILGVINPSDGRS